MCKLCISYSEKRTQICGGQGHISSEIIPEKAMPVMMYRPPQILYTNTVEQISQISQTPVTLALLSPTIVCD